MKEANERLKRGGSAAAKFEEDLALASGASLQAVAERWPWVGQALERAGLAGSSLSVADACRLKGWDLPTTLALLEEFGGIAPPRFEAAFELLGVEQLCERFAEGEHRELKARMRRVMDAVANEDGETDALVRTKARDFEAALARHLATESEALAMIRGEKAKVGLRRLLAQLRREHERLLELWSDLKLACESFCPGAQDEEGARSAARREIDAMEELLQRQVYLENHALFQRGSALVVAEAQAT